MRGPSVGLIPIELKPIGVGILQIQCFTDAVITPVNFETKNLLPLAAFLALRSNVHSRQREASRLGYDFAQGDQDGRGGRATIPFRKGRKLSEEAVHRPSERLVALYRRSPSRM